MPAEQTWRNDKYRKQVLATLEKYRTVYFFDTETTGLSDKNDRIIEIAVLKCALGEDNFPKELDRLHLYIRPPFALDPKIVELTGITDEQLEECPYEEDCFDKVANFFAEPSLAVAGHNVSFDVRFLKALYARNGAIFPAECAELDTCQMARDVFTKAEVKDYKLKTLVHYCGFDDGVTFHSAIEDIQATTKLFYLLLIEYLNREYEEMQSIKSQKSKPAIRYINFWEGHNGYSRIYVGTSAGSLYFDIRRKSWAPKDMNLDTVDMDYIEQSCWIATGATNADEFSRYTGRMWL